MIKSAFPCLGDIFQISIYSVRRLQGKEKSNNCKKNRKNKSDTSDITHLRLYSQLD